jgi:hypothetical protein
MFFFPVFDRFTRTEVQGTKLMHPAHSRHFPGTGAKHWQSIPPLKAAACQADSLTASYCATEALRCIDMLTAGFVRAQKNNRPAAKTRTMKRAFSDH